MRNLQPLGPTPESIESWRRVGEQVEARLAASGLPPCAWLPLQSNLSLAAFRDHAKTCRTCAERDRIASEYDRDAPTGSAELDLGVGKLALAYTGVLAISMGAVALANAAAGVPPLRSIPVVSGVILLAASSGKPTWLYDVVRHLRMVGLIRDDGVARVVLALLGVACCVMGVVGWLR